MGNIAVHAAPAPFSQFQLHTTAKIGSSLAEIVAETIPEKYIGKVDVVAQIDGHIIFPKHWHAVRPKAGTVVNIRAVPMGGKGKNPIATVLSIAVMIAAPYAAGALATNVALGVFGGGVATAGQVALTKGLLTAGFSILGRLAVSAIAPPPKPVNAGVVSNPAESPTQFIEGATNQLNPYGVVPVCLGTNRMVPPQAARPFTETQDNNNFVRQLFTWGYGQQLQVTDLKIGETSLTDFDDVETSSRLNGDLNLGTTLFSNSVVQENVSILLNEPDGFTTRAVAVNSNEAILDVTWPQGLAYINELGTRGSLSIELQLQYRLSGSSGAWTNVSIPTVTGSQTEALVKSFRVIFPAAGNYDIRIRRVTPTYVFATDTYFQDTYLTAIRGVRYQNPVNAPGLNGIAIRIRATDQLNGSIDQLNGIVSNLIPDYDVDTDTWITRASSNPASIYRYVLQSFPNARRMGDSGIRIEDLEAWHGRCVARGYTYNRVIDYDTSVEEVLADVASAGAASPAIVDGKRTVVVDEEKDDIIQIVTPRNSWDYQGEMVYPELPHAFRVTFRNADAGYQQDERIVYADGYDADTATLFETLDLPACTDSDLAYKTARRLLATAILRPETHTFSMDVENLVAIRGNRIKLEHDIPLVGIGDARLKSVETDFFPNNVIDGANNVVDGANEVIDFSGVSASVVSVSLDDTISIPTAGTYYMRIRKSDGSLLYKQIVANVGQFTSFAFSEPFDAAGAPEAGDLCYIVEAGGEVDLVISRIEPGPDLTAKITAVDYAPGIFDAETGPIPSFDSHITVPLEFVRPVPPVLLQAPQVDESVMLRNPDGSFLSRAIITLRNDNEGQVTPEVKIRVTGTTLFVPANLLESTPGRVAITGLTAGTRYDVFIRYRRANSSIYSLPLQLNSMLYVGTTGLPSDVTGFKISVTDATALFSWDKNEDIDFSHYVMKFSSRTDGGVTWNTAQMLLERIFDNRLTLSFQGGTYLIKAVDQLGNESENATVITALAPARPNAVIEFSEDPTFAGVKTDVEVDGGALRLSDPTIMQGTYAFANVADLGAIYTAFVSASIVAGGVVIDDSSSLENNIFDMPDLFDVPDIFGLSEGSWNIGLEFRYTTDDPDDSSAVWTDWDEFVASNYIFRGMQFRLQLYSLEMGVSPQVSELGITIDMPDRTERGEDLTVLTSGFSITYDPPFKTSPSLWVTLQDGDEGDEIEFTEKDATGFAFRVYNKTTLAYVERTFDYGASGYGREST